MKWWGVGAVLLACILFAAARTRERRREIACLRSLCCSLDRIHAELSCALIPLPVLMERLAEDGNNDAALFFSQVHKALDQLDEKEFSRIWADAAERNLKQLQSAEYQEVVELGQWLGKYTLDEQLIALERCASVLRQRRDRCCEVFAEERKMSYGISLALGCFLSMMLL